jgi:hypothetical protein
MRHEAGILLGEVALSTMLTGLSDILVNVVIIVLLRLAIYWTEKIYKSLKPKDDDDTNI